MTIRPIRDDDWPEIDRIQQECFPPSAVESREVLQSIARLAPETCFLAETDRPFGYVLSHPWMKDDLPPLQDILPALPAAPESLFIHDLAVAPRSRGHGAGVKLAARALQAGRDLGLKRGSLLSVQGSHVFWSRFGFLPSPELTERFRPVVARLYQLDFQFMTAADLSVAAGAASPDR